jgi:hypothetical protein
VNRTIDIYLPSSTISATLVPLTLVKFSSGQLQWFFLFEGKSYSELVWPQSIIKLSHYFGAFLWQLLRLRLKLVRVCNELNIDICSFVDAFTGLAVSHSNYNTVSQLLPPRVDQE